MRDFDPVSVFGLTTQTLDALFRRYRLRAGLEGFTFHDARHTAATRIGLSGKLSALELAKMFGWRDLKRCLTYFNPTVGELAAKL
jgi:integrase